MNLNTGGVPHTEKCINAECPKLDESTSYLQMYGYAKHSTFQGAKGFLGQQDLTRAPAISLSHPILGHYIHTICDECCKTSLLKVVKWECTRSSNV